MVAILAHARCVHRFIRLSHNSVFHGSVLEQRDKAANGRKLPIFLRAFQAHGIGILLVERNFGQEVLFQDQPCNALLLQIAANIVGDLQLVVLNTRGNLFAVCGRKSPNLFLVFSPRIQDALHINIVFEFLLEPQQSTTTGFFQPCWRFFPKMLAQQNLGRIFKIVTASLQCGSDLQRVGNPVSRLPVRE